MAVASRPLLTKLTKHLLLVPFLVFALFPFYHMTITSLKQDRELYDRNAVPLVIKQGPTLEHYSKLLWDTEFLTWTKNSLMVTALATFVSVVIGTIAAYALARLKFFGVAAFGTGIFVTFPRSSAIALSWSGSRCCTTTKAMPLSAGMFAKNVVKASSPPAEAPMPTIRGDACNFIPGWESRAACVALDLRLFRCSPFCLRPIME